MRKEVAMNRVDISEAKALLDPLLRDFTIGAVARASGLGWPTLKNIDHRKHPKVDASTVRALQKAVATLIPRPTR